MFQILANSQSLVCPLSPSDPLLLFEVVIGSTRAQVRHDRGMLRKPLHFGEQETLLWGPCLLCEERQDPGVSALVTPTPASHPPTHTPVPTRQLLLTTYHTRGPEP